MARQWPALDITFDAGAVADLIAAVLDEFEPTAIEELDRDDFPAWRVFFANAARRDDARSGLAAAFAERLTLAPVDVADEGWAERSQASLGAVRVGTVTIAPPWDQSSSPSGLLVTIYPSMGFGTGHHASTRVCLRVLQRLDVRGRSVLDVGTGSGVLAIVAARMGADSVVAIDVDPDATSSAEENLRLNDLTDRVLLLTGDFRRTDLSPADLVLANLTGGLLAADAKSLVAVVAARGRMVLGGFSQSEEPAVLRAFGGWTVATREQEEEWVAVLLNRLMVDSQ